jgi:branched-chain amino acid transport system substrate-binding protein
MLGRRIKRWERALAIALLACGLTVFTAACGGGSKSSTPSGGSSGAGGEPILIGVVSAKSGFMSPFDVPARVGVQRAIDKINKSGGLLGRPLKMITWNSKSDTTEAARGATNLLRKGAKFLFVSCDFDYGGPAATVAQAQNILSFSCAASPKFGPQGIGNNAFTIETLTPDEGATMAEWGYEKKKWRRAYVLTDTSIDYSKTLGRYFTIRWKELSGASGVVGEDTFQNADASFQAQVTRLRSVQPAPDVVYVASCTPGGATMIRQIRAAGVLAPIASGICMDGDYWLKTVPGLKDFWHVAEVSAYGDDPEPKINAFLNDVKQSLTSDQAAQAFYAVEGYSAMQAWAMAVKQAKSLGTDAVRAKLESFKDAPLMIGPTTFTPELHGDVKRPYRILEVNTGHNAYVDTWRVRKAPPV